MLARSGRRSVSGAGGPRPAPPATGPRVPPALFIAPGRRQRSVIRSHFEVLCNLAPIVTDWVNSGRARTSPFPASRDSNRQTRVAQNHARLRDRWWGSTGPRVLRLTGIERDGTEREPDGTPTPTGSLTLHNAVRRRASSSLNPRLHVSLPLSTSLYFGRT